ncbi:PAS domain S-box-containing protein [Mariprofundus aestuarium]|uniref:histidine kinase n=1 Tax=Mariprofundus aestuarium TaxID=1921086 RepID=A0A2K8L0I4_MARES|nr:ATP-binding protein [Mariprofundus aestuarium]ATX79321.1 PAS domain S-box-containing protein [Mariprofundus aestuarium]
MSQRKKYPLRIAWYGLIMVASVLPAIALSPWLGQQAHALLLERAMLSEEVFHNEIETRLALETNRLVSVLITNADPIGIVWSEQQNLEQLNGIIERASGREPMLNSIAIYDSHARFITGSKQGDHTFSSIRNDMAEFAVPMHGRSFLGAPVKLSDNHYEFLISVPIMKQSKPVGVLLGTVNIAEFWNVTRGALPEHDSKIYLVDSRGSLLIHGPETHHLTGDLLSNKEIVRSLLSGSGWKRPDIYRGFEEKDVFGIATLVDGLKWGIISEIPSNAIMAPILSALKTLTIIVFLLHILFGLISLLFTRHLLSPISDLAKVVKKATEGDYSQQAMPSPYEEINSLTTDFNSMIREISSREASLQKLSQAIDQAGEAILICNRDGILEYVNPAFSEATGYSIDEAVGSMPKDIVNSGMQSESFYQELWKTILSGDPWEGALTNRRKDGSHYPVLMSIAPIVSDGKITHFVAIQQNMSKQNLLEDQLRQSQKMESLGTLVGGIAHDFNNLLAGMTGNLYLAKIKSNNSPDAIKNIENVEKLSFKAAGLISQLLTYARKGPVQMHEIELCNHMQNALKLIQAGIPENIELTADFSNELLPIWGDSTQLDQILMNLLSNAKDAVADSNNPHIHIAIQPFESNDSFRRFHPHHADIDNYAQVTVRDNGHGISEEQVELIFEPFYTTKEVGKGSGLGLAMIYGAMQTHNAIIDVTSQLDRGSEFHLYFPLIEAPIIETVNGAIEEHHGQGQGILIVDDEPTLCETCCEIVESMGYRSFSAPNGREGLELFKQQSASIDLILTDVVMPKLSGPEMVGYIRKSHPDIPVIFMTGYDKSLLSKEVELKNSMVTPKPLNIVEFRHHVGKLLRNVKI